MPISASLRAFAANPAHRNRLAFTGDRDLSYSGLVDRVDRAAAILRRSGIAPGDVVATVLYNDAALYVLFLACREVGAALLPLSPRQTASERRRVLERTAASQCWAGDGVELGELPAGCAARHVDEIEREPPAAPSRRAGGEDEACWIAATGGSTGEPRLWVIPERNLEDNLRINVAAWGLDRHGVHVSVAPLAHGIGFCNALAQLLTGGTVHLTARLSPAAAVAGLRAHERTWTALVPTLLLDIAEAAGEDIPGFELAVCAGATLTARVRERVAQALPGLAILEYYGSTEMGWVTSQFDDGWREAPGSVGRATPGTRLEIRRTDGSPAPLGEIGEVFKRGRPYAAAPFETRDEPWIGPDDWVSSGDRGRLDAEGRLHLAGRTDDLIIVGGLNVDPSEIEAHLVRCPGVADAVVVGVPDERLGERVHAVVASERDPEELRADLADLVRRELSGYKAPTGFTIVRELPRNPAGKISRAQVRERLVEDDR